jgi:hypothetical protein
MKDSRSFVICDTQPKRVKSSNKCPKNRIKSPPKNTNSFVTFVEHDPDNTIHSINKKNTTDVHKTTRLSSKVQKSIVDDATLDKDTIDMNSYNIFHIDTIIRQKLNEKISSLPSLEEDLRKLLTALMSKDTSANDKLSAQQQITMLRTRIQDIETTFELNLYIYRTADILIKYANLLESESSRTFVFSDENRKTYTQQSAEKLELVSQYISIAREYVDIKNYKKIIKLMSCPFCKTSDMTKNVDEDTSFVCQCGVEIEIFDDTPSFKDTDRVNMSNRYTYTRRGHFIEAMKKYQGKHNVDTEQLQTVAAHLRSEMKFYNLTPTTVSKDRLYTFLSEKKLCDHYEDINILYHIITGKECPEFSHLENTLLELFEEQEKALIEVTALDPNDERLNSINVYYKLFKLLQKLGYPCKKSDFHILKTKAKEDEHDEKMFRAWGLLGWPWIETT